MVLQPVSQIFYQPSIKGIPEAILDREMVKRGCVAATKVLVKWKDLLLDLATWESYYDLLKQYPNYHLKVKGALKGQALSQVYVSS
jgi:hypothetical protein